jgi:hypothetical protein
MDAAGNGAVGQAKAQRLQAQVASFRITWVEGR